MDIVYSLTVRESDVIISRHSEKGEEAFRCPNDNQEAYDLWVGFENLIKVAERLGILTRV